MNRVTTLYYKKKDSCSDKACRVVGHAACILIQTLYVIFNISVMMYSYIERPEKEDDLSGYHEINTLLVWNAIYLISVFPFIIPNTHAINCVKTISYIITSICLAVYWWAFPIEDVEHFNCSIFYVGFAVLFSIQLFVFCLIRESLNKVKPSSNVVTSSCAAV